MNCDKLSRILLRTAVAIFLIAAAIHICTYGRRRSQSDTSIEHNRLKLLDSCSYHQAS